MTHRILPLAITLAIVALALAARAQPAERPEPAPPPAATAPAPARPPVVLPAEEAERLVALLAEAPAKWSFEALQILLARMRPPAATTQEGR